jgi:hypothetical protein
MTFLYGDIPLHHRPRVHGHTYAPDEHSLAIMENYGNEGNIMLSSINLNNMESIEASEAFLKKNIPSIIILGVENSGNITLPGIFYCCFILDVSTSNIIGHTA